MPHIKRSLAGAIAFGLLGVALGGCGLTEPTETIKSFELTSGTNASVDDLAIRNVVLVTAGEGRASLVAYISNRSSEDDSLREVRVSGQPVELAEAIDIPAGSYVSIGDPTGPQVTVDNLDTPPGRYVEMQLVFDRAPQATMQVLVEPAEGPYAGLAPAAPETATPTAGATPSPTATASPGPTTSPSPTASPSPTS